MGMPDRFDEERADLLGINGIACPTIGCLHVDFVSHTASLSVDEEGTQASAATGTGLITLVGHA